MFGYYGFPANILGFDSLEKRVKVPDELKSIGPYNFKVAYATIGITGSDVAITYLGPVLRVKGEHNFSLARIEDFKEFAFLSESERKLLEDYKDDWILLGNDHCIYRYMDCPNKDYYSWAKSVEGWSREVDFLHFNFGQSRVFNFAPLDHCLYCFYTPEGDKAMSGRKELMNHYAFRVITKENGKIPVSDLIKDKKDILKERFEQLLRDYTANEEKELRVINLQKRTFPTGYTDCDCCGERYYKERTTYAYHKFCSPRCSSEFRRK